MLLVPKLFKRLQEIEKIQFRGADAPQHLGSFVSQVLLEYLPVESVTVYLSSETGEGLVRAFGHHSHPERIETDTISDKDAIAAFDPMLHTLIPISNTKDTFGAIGVRGRGELSEDDVEALSAIGSYLAAFFAASRMAFEIREGDFQLRYHLWELEALLDIGLSIASMLDLSQLGDEILMRTMSLVNARRSALYLRVGEKFELHQSLGGARAQFLGDEISEEDADTLFNVGKPLIFETKADCVFPGCESLVAMPIRSNDGEVIGVLAAADREFRDGSVGGFDEGELRLLTRFANQVSIALQNAKLHIEAVEKQAIEKDLELAASIQRDILPRTLPDLDGYEVAVLSNPARQVGGDYYVFFEHEDKLSCCVADVSGKSVPAAILVSALHAALQLLFHEGRELGEIASELNRHIHRWSSASKFITLVLATIDRNEGVVHYVNAGHNPAYVVNGGVIETLPSHGLPVGIMGTTNYVTQSSPFLPGSLLALYSDGITEAANAVDDEFGPERLLAVLLDGENRPAVEIVDVVRDAVGEFAAGEPQYDDQTLVLIRSSGAS